MEIQEQVAQIVKEKGPLIPADLYKTLNKDILMTSAILSELVSKNILHLSHVKLGGSPLYYAPGQEEKLQDFSHLLHEKEQKAYQSLKQKKVLRDRALAPVVRVALRQLKDFAVPLQVKTGDGVEMFWKWYLTKNEEAELLIRKELGIKRPGKEVQKPLQQEEAKPAGKPQKSKTGFLESALDYFRASNITVHEKEIVRKNEIDFVIEVPSKMGNLRYYCKAKSKKRSSDTDLSAAFTQGQFRKLPVIYLSDGELTKRAKEMLEKQLSGITVRRM